MSTENIETKEDIKKIIDESTDYKELYDNAIKVLQRMEATFKGTLKDLADQGKWAYLVNQYNLVDQYDSEYKREDVIDTTIFDENLNTTYPITIFEKKGKDFILRAKNIAKNNLLLNTWIQLAKRVKINRLDDKSKEIIVDELRETRLAAIQDIKADLADDGVINNENNIDEWGIKNQGKEIGGYIFESKERHTLEKAVKNMSLQKLILGTFNIEEGSGAFNYSFQKIKEKLGNRNLFDYIDSLNKTGDQLYKVLKYSSIRMLLKRRKSSDLINWINGYKGDKWKLLEYIKQNVLKDKDFKIGFLSSIKDLENRTDFNGFFDKLSQEVKKDPNVKKAYENASKLKSPDIFTSGKINALAIYDDAGHGGGADYFDSNLEHYKNNGFTVKPEENNTNYTKYTLEKNNGMDRIVMIKLNIERNCLNIEDIKKSLSPLIKNSNFNLFALRGHCYNTRCMGNALGGLNAVKEDDVLINGGCWQADEIEDFYLSGIKGQMFAYTAEGRGTSTQAFIDKSFNAKKNGKSYSDILGYYDKLYGSDDDTVDNYFANNTERPDSVVYQYRILTAGK